MQYQNKKKIEIMRTIDIAKIITEKKLIKKEVAKQLFPDNKYPDLALNRIIKGENVLDANQISKLALLSGLKISELFSGEPWKSKPAKAGIIALKNGAYYAELDTQTWVTKIFHNDSLFHESVITAGTQPLSEFISSLDIIINNQKTKQS